MLETWINLLDLTSQVQAKDNKFTLLARAGRQVRFLLVTAMICFVFRGVSLYCCRALAGSFPSK
jgi:hypothetical protein